MIQDQHEEEFYLSYLQPKVSGDAPKDNSPSKPAPVEQENGLIYKYYSELTPEDLKSFDCRPDFHGPSQ